MKEGLYKKRGKKRPFFFVFTTHQNFAYIVARERETTRNEDDFDDDSFETARFILERRRRYKVTPFFISLSFRGSLVEKRRLEKKKKKKREREK